MARVIKCPKYGKIRKIKHNSYENFTCCYMKFPIAKHDVLERQRREEEDKGKTTLVVMKDMRGESEERVLAFKKMMQEINAI